MRKKASGKGKELNPYLLKINRLLNERKWSASYLSLQAGLGSSTISNLFKRNNVPTVATLEKLCAVFNISLSTFFKAIEEEFPDLSIWVRMGKLPPSEGEPTRKDIIMGEWAGLSVNEKRETLKDMIDELGNT